MMQVREFLKRTIDIIKRPYMRILPGQLAFFSIMSLIPLIALVGSIANYFSLSLDSIKNVTSSILPIDLSTLFTSEAVSGKGLNFNIIIFFISAFILASNGTHSVIITANEIYNYQEEGILARRLKAIAMIFVLVGLLFFLLAVTVFGDLFFEVLKEYATNQTAVSIFQQIYDYLKMPLSIVLIYFNIKQLYQMAPDNRVSTISTKYAAIFTTIVWTIGTEIYSVYVRFFSNYNLFYGSISNILILMVWIYFLAYIFVLGMALSTTNIEKIKIKKENKSQLD